MPLASPISSHHQAFASVRRFFFFHSIAFFFSRSLSRVCLVSPSFVHTFLSLSPVPIGCTYVSSTMFVPSVVAAFLRHDGRVVAAHHPNLLGLTQKRRDALTQSWIGCAIWGFLFLGYPNPNRKIGKEKTEPNHPWRRDREPSPMDPPLHPCATFFGGQWRCACMRARSWRGR